MKKTTKAVAREHYEKGGAVLLSMQPTQSKTLGSHSTRMIRKDQTETPWEDLPNPQTFNEFDDIVGSYRIVFGSPYYYIVEKERLK